MLNLLLFLKLRFSIFSNVTKGTQRNVPPRRLVNMPRKPQITSHSDVFRGFRLGWVLKRHRASVWP